MSVYNHRPMVPAPQNRVVEMLETIRSEFDQLAQELYACKIQRDDFEHKMKQQISEMDVFQQSLIDLERTQQNQKKHYEDEIARLRQQIEARGGGHPGMPSALPNHSQQPSRPQQPSSHSQQQSQPPPNIGPGSNYFGGIMNAHGTGLVAPPQMNEQGPPPSQQQPPPPSHHYPSSQPPTQPNSSAPNYSHLNASNSASPYPPGRGMPTPPTSAHPPQQQQQQQQSRDHSNSNNGYNNYSSSSSRPGSNVSPQDASFNKRKLGSTSSSVPTPTQNSQMVSRQSVPPPANKAPIPSPTTPSGLADVDPDSVSPNMKVEGSDWFALFNPKTARQLNVNLMHTLEHESVVCCVKFSADGRFLAAGCNRVTYIYDVSTSNRVAALKDDKIKAEGDLYIRSVCFSHDGQYLATGAEDMQIRIWDIRKKEIQRVLSGHKQDIYSLDFSRNGDLIASGSGDCTARIWSVKDGKCNHVLKITDHDQKDPGVTSVAFSPDGRLLAAASLDRMVRTWDTHTGILNERLEGHKDSVYSVAFMPDGKTLVSGSLDKTLKLWQLRTNEGRGLGPDSDRSKAPCKMTFTGHKDFVLSVGCTPDGRWVVSGSKDRGVQFWDPRSGQTQFILQGHKNSVISVAISPSGKQLFATGSGDNRARIWSYNYINA